MPTFTASPPTQSQAKTGRRSGAQALTSDAAGGCSTGGVLGIVRIVAGTDRGRERLTTE
jgi:hypothetical protein